MKLCELKDCTGCMACYNACHFDAIKLITDKMGRIVPEIHQDKCKECGLCAKACPALNPVQKNTPQTAYVAYTNNTDDRKTCTSGGIATVFSRLFVENGDVVFGSAFADNQVQVMMASDDKQLEAFKGSKYVYSFPAYSYRQVKDYLNKGRKCLFIGTPCQVAGLKAYLQGRDENLLTVDLICHGTPPMAYLREHLNDLGLPENVRVAFRGEKGFNLCAFDENSKELMSKPHEEDTYFFSFIKGLTYREPCYSCQFACPERVSDITIGDFWGLSSDALNGYRGRKSVILINTDKGRDYFEKTADRITYEKREVSEAVNGNEQLRKPSRIPADRTVFERVYVEKGFEEAVKATSIYKTIRKYRIKNFILHYPKMIKKKLLK